ncbi:MAG: hypothetical protein KJO41_03425 [Bacteroidia bacterium]|nr:hypothetical protein [Bacteroidia bacterium]MBT8278028.1 hypothetical protein [Bacteroidia bacterium]NND26942.1 hypothetical protein [Flavobacteriaceae bacterium]NNK60359.1 hypothetical protein [Flavobacteriaceae bacterium]NNL33959.1 hypothetical protein [Flavobacteriaceae bacterium]
MEAPKKIRKLREWISPESMKLSTDGWLSELQFIKDEQLFFTDLIKNYTLQMIEKKHFEESKKLVEHISQLQKKNKVLLSAMRMHKNELEIMVDGIDQLKEEENYKKKHLDFIKLMNKYLKEYKALKSDIFKLIKEIMIEEKNKRLLK